MRAFDQYTWLSCLLHGGVWVNGDTSHSNEGRRLLFPFLASIYRAIEPLTYFLVRVLAGLFLALHGAQKVFGWFGGDPAGETAAFARLGLCSTAS
jgi:hypothetical protein